MPDHLSGPDLIRATGLMPDGPGVLGRPIRSSGPGVYVVELATPLPRAPIDMTIVGKWIERLPALRVDGDVPTSKALANRMAAFWIPSSPVLFVGSSEQSIAGRVQALERHVLGDRRPHAASQWLKTLRIDGLRVWWASTDTAELYEDELLNAFAASVSPEERAALYDSETVLPWANLGRRSTSARKKTGITGFQVPEEPAAPAPGTRVRDLPPGDADGLTPSRSAGTTRRTNTTRPPAPGTRVPRARTPAGTTIRAPRAGSKAALAAARAPVVGVRVTPEGLERLNAELADLTLVQRPEIIERIARARELGDLKENADYTTAREAQSFLEGRVQAIEAQLRHAVVVGAGDATRVTLGSRVTVELDGEEHEFTVVGPAESDPGSGRISSVSPMGQALMGRAAGDQAIVSTPKAKVSYRVVSIA